MTMNERLRHARFAAGYTTAAAAIRAYGWKVSTYMAHENGQNEFDTENAAIYAKAYKTSAEWLLLGVNMPITHESIDAQLAHFPEHVSRKLREKFTDMIEAVKIVGATGKDN
jgi:phage repressor protein C with HTH and peptisase S24 domain